MEPSATANDSTKCENEHPPSHPSLSLFLYRGGIVLNGIAASHLAGSRTLSANLLTRLLVEPHKSETPRSILHLCIIISQNLNLATMKPIVLDGRTGEGGGQLVRVAIAIAALTTQAVTISHVRGNRERGGMRA